MAYSASKGLLALPIDYSKSSGYTYQKLSYKYIQPNGALTITPNQMQDLDSYVNGDGYLKRKVLKHSRTKIEWNTPYLTYEDKCKLILAIRKGYKQGMVTTLLELFVQGTTTTGKMITPRVSSTCLMYSFNMAGCITEHQCICRSVWR